MVDGDRKHLATVVVHVLADEVHAPGSGGDALRFFIEGIDEKSTSESWIHTFIGWHASCFYYGSVVEAGPRSRSRLIRRVPTNTPVTCA